MPFKLIFQFVLLFLVGIIAVRCMVAIKEKVRRVKEEQERQRRLEEIRQLKDKEERERREREEAERHERELRERQERDQRERLERDRREREAQAARDEAAKRDLASSSLPPPDDTIINSLYNMANSMHSLQVRV